MENRVCENQETTIMRAFEFRKEGLEYLQKLPLEEKITLSKNLIVSCMETFGEQVYISFSGGKDSTVLSSLVCSLKPDILHLFSDTGYEYPETLSFVEEERQRGKNIVPVRPVWYGPLSVSLQLMATHYSPRRLPMEYGHIDTRKRL